MDNSIIIDNKVKAIDFGGLTLPYSSKMLWACINTLIVQGEPNITVITKKPYKALKALKGKGYNIEIDNACIWACRSDTDIYIFTPKQYNLF